MKQDNLTPLDNAIYYIFCILTLGTPFISKVIAKKAIQEMLRNSQ